MHPQFSIEAEACYDYTYGGYGHFNITQWVATVRSGVNRNDDDYSISSEMATLEMSFAAPTPTEAYDGLVRHLKESELVW